MIIFDNVFAASYKFYSPEKDQIRVRASLFVTGSEFFIATMIFNILLGNDWIKVYLNFKYSHYFAGLIFFIIYGINYYYYSNNRISKIITRFETKSKSEIIFWNFFSIVSILFPLLYGLFIP